MKRDFLAQSLKNAQNAKATAEPVKAGEPHIKTVTSVAESLKRLSANAVQEVDPVQIRDSRFSDRIDPGTGIEDLAQSIEESGQQVPVLLRHLPKEPGTYEVVYGRRRIAACRKLGIRARAIISEFTEEQALIAQGLENAARVDTTFIERARFAAQIEASGAGSQSIMRALGVDKAALSKMKRVTSFIPEDIIVAIGPAPAHGRRPWLELTSLVEQHPDFDLGSVINPEHDSSERLTHLIAQIKSVDKKAVQPVNKLPLAGGRASITRRKATLQIKLNGPESGLLASELEKELSTFIEEWFSMKSKA